MRSGNLIRRKSIRHLDLILLSLLAIFFSTCMDLSEFEPEGPPQTIDPPEGPSVILPAQDAIFYCDTGTIYRYVTLNWTSVIGAQAYEFQVSTDSSFLFSFPYQGQWPPTAFAAVLFGFSTTYYFRVRAYSSQWTWYTDWSETRRFHLMVVE